MTALRQPATLLDELLYEKRYSLYWEGLRWIDMRRYGKLAELPHDKPTAKVFPYFPLPDDECVPRGRPAASCVAPAGF